MNRWAILYLKEGIHRNVSHNQTLAGQWSSTNCPSGPDRQFGPCEAIDGVVVQERAGWTHVLAVAFDFRTTTEREQTDLSTVIRTVGDDSAYYQSRSAATS